MNTPIAEVTREYDVTITFRNGEVITVKMNGTPLAISDYFFDSPFFNVESLELN